MHLHFDNASPVIDIEALFPSLPTICGFKNTSLFVVSIKSSQGPDINRFRIGGMDDDLADLECFLKTHVGPRLAAIRRFVDTIAVADRVSRIVFAGPHPNDIWVAPCHRYRPDRHRRFTIELVRE